MQHASLSNSKRFAVGYFQFPRIPQSAPIAISSIYGAGNPRPCAFPATARLHVVCGWNAGPLFPSRTTEHLLSLMVRRPDVDSEAHVATKPNRPEGKKARSRHCKSYSAVQQVRRRSKFRIRATQAARSAAQPASPTASSCPPRLGRFPLPDIYRQCCPPPSLTTGMVWLQNNLASTSGCCFAIPPHTGA